MSASLPEPDSQVPESVVRSGTMPPLRYRDLPPALPIRKLLGPSIILAGLALGSGEFVLWPFITYKTGFVFFWACVVGVTLQYFLNMEIVRGSLATGESAITGFIRCSRGWAGVFLLLNVLPWMIPAWATGAAELASWQLHPPDLTLDAESGNYVISGEKWVTPLAIAGLFLCGVVLTAGPVVYETVERIQLVLVTLVLALIVGLAVMVVRPDAVVALCRSTVTLGYPDFVPPAGTPGLDPIVLLGAIAFAGAGGTMNLGQSNYVKDKGYGMGVHIGRITSPLTGQVESIAETGYLFRPSDENRARWRSWWRAAGWEHFFSFYLTCLVCLVLLALISYSTFYTPDGVLRPGAERYGQGMTFILGEADEVGSLIGSPGRVVFLLVGIAILLTTEIAVLDAASRISTDVVKVAWLRNRPQWTESRLYFWCLWGTILLGSGILLLKQVGLDIGAFQLFKMTAAMNGGVMFVYSGLLLYVNRFRLPREIRTSGWRCAVMVVTFLFFGTFTLAALVSTFR